MKKFWIPYLFFLLSFYSFGAGLMDSFVIYNSWRFVDADKFAAMHQVSGQRIVISLVLPMLVLTVLCILMFWHRPPMVSKKLVTIAFLALMAGWVSSIFIQIPIQAKLSTGKDDVLLHKLIVTDWIRIAAWCIYLPAIFKMLQQIKHFYASKNMACNTR